MSDVARAAGVSLKTVSRVVNRESGVTPETSERVRAAIDSLGFRRNEAARALRQGRVSQTLGLDRKSTRLNSSHESTSRMPSSA